MDRYEIAHLIGEGSFGKVFVGRHKLTKRAVALKQISKGGRLEKEIKSLQQECDIQQNLHHPNIIQMLDSYETDDAIVVVTELAQGDLQKVQQERKRQGFVGLSVQKITCDLVSALYFLHSNRILHRDLKPQNILIGMDGKAKLCDFGFAKTMDLNSYMLTSIKGTPLYMAPEIVEEKPYDHNADLWSLGCIIYELLVGQPPFYTASLIELVWKIKNDEILWDRRIHGDCLSFLKGLLEKDPKQRLTWPDLLSHPYVSGRLNIDRFVDEKALTKALSPSQELAKESERQTLQKRLEGYSKLMEKTARKYEETHQKLKRCSVDGQLAALPNPSDNVNHTKSSNKNVPPSNQRETLCGGPSTLPRSASAKELQVMLDNLTLGTPERPTNNIKGSNRSAKGNYTGCESTSCETLSSSSDSETGRNESEDAPKPDKTLRNRNQNTRVQNANGSKDSKHAVVKIINPSNTQHSSNSNCSGRVLFTLHSRGATDSPINTDEWLFFLMKTTKEVMENPKSLAEKHFLNVVVPPLKNQSSEAQVINRLALLLSLPFAKFADEDIPGLVPSLLTAYSETKVLPHLMFACKLIVINRAKGMCLTFEALCELLTDEDLDALDECMQLISFLVHVDESFATQFCGCVFSLNVTGVLQLFLKLDDRKGSLAEKTLASLCQLLRTFPKNKGITSATEDVLLDKKENSVTSGSFDELWRLMTHNNPLIQSKSIRVFTYLFANSDRLKAEFSRDWMQLIFETLFRVIESSHVDVQKAAEFGLKTVYRNYSSKRNPETIGPDNQNNLLGTSCPRNSTSTTGSRSELEINANKKNLPDLTSNESLSTAKEGQNVARRGSCYKSANESSR